MPFKKVEEVSILETNYFDMDVIFVNICHIMHEQLINSTDNTFVGGQNKYLKIYFI